MADHGHELTDEMLADLEKRLRKEYEQSAKEVQEKLDKYMKKFTTKDAIWKKSVDAGIRTQEEYDKWRLQAIAAGERWEKMKARIVADQLHTNQIAREIIDREMPGIFELNANFALYQVEHDSQIDTSLTLYNREAVDRILRDDPEMLLPPGQKVSEQIRQGKAERWERNKVQSVMTQGILQGESIPKLASRLASAVADSDYKAAVRNARTMATNAQNAGRYDAYNRLESNGVDLTLEWAATLDNRTRHEHRMMHGQRRNVGEPFEVSGVKIMYPAQTGSFMGISNLPQELLWNCRCTILAYVKGYEHDTITHSDKMGKMTFEEWLEAKPKSQNILHQAQRGDQIEQDYINEYRKMNKEADEILKNRSTVVNGKDISETWERRPDKFDFAIDDVINAQGFDGKPRVVSPEEFDRISKENGVVCKRGYNTNYETGSEDRIAVLDRYHEELINGKWYVDCHNGSAQYGQGMYSYIKHGSTTHTNVMDDAVSFYSGKDGRVETFTISKDAKIVKSSEIDKLKQKEEDLLQKRTVEQIFNKDMDPVLKDIAMRMAGLEKSWGKEAQKAMDAFQNMSEKEQEYIYSKVGEYERRRREEAGKFKKMDNGVFAASKGYDAIEADYDLGDDTHELVVLNRTKCIFKGK